MKKLLYLILFSMSALMLNACKESEELVVWAWNRNVSIMEKAIELYQEEVDSNFTARVESFSQSDIDVKFKASNQLNASYDMADIILLDAMKLRQYYDLWPELFYDFSENLSAEEQNNYVPSTIEIATVDHKLVAMPFGIAPTYVFGYRPLWDEDVLTDIIENGWTWDDYKTYGLEIKQNHPEQEVYMTAYNMRGDDRLFRTMTSQKGEWFMSNDLQVQIGDNVTTEAITKVKDLYDSGVVGHIDTGDYKSMMLNGEIAAQIQGFFLGGQIKSIGEDTSGDWILLPLPSWEENTQSASITGGSYLYVNDLKNHSRSAAEFVKWCVSTDDAVISALDTGGIFPALLSAYDTEYFDQLDPFFGDQQFLKEVASSVSLSPAIYASKYNAFNYNTYIEGQESILFNDADITTTLNAIKTTMKQNAEN